MTVAAMAMAMKVTVTMAAKMMAAIMETMESEGALSAEPSVAVLGAREPHRRLVELREQRLSKKLINCSGRGCRTPATSRSC